jgi:hypothetical protein
MLPRARIPQELDELADRVSTRLPPEGPAAAELRTPGALGPEAARSLQRAIGNRAAARMLAPPAGVRQLQRDDDITKSKISETTDTGNKYTQDLVLNKTKARIQIQLAVNWVKQGTWATDADFWTFVRKVKTAAYGYLDRKFKVVCTPTAPAAGNAPIELPIDFLIYDMPSGYTIEAHGGAPGGGSQMAEAGGKVFEYDGNGALEEGITYAHEFGHAILGASDEYANPAVPGRVLTNDHSIMANYYAQGKAQAEFKARHFQHIVTEVAKAFAGYTCGLREM